MGRRSLSCLVMIVASGCASTAASSTEGTCIDDPLPAPAAACPSIAGNYTVHAAPRCANTCGFKPEQGSARVTLSGTKVNIVVDTTSSSSNTGCTLQGCSCVGIDGAMIVFTTTGYASEVAFGTFNPNGRCIAQIVTQGTRN